MTQEVNINLRDMDELVQMKLNDPEQYQKWLEAFKEVLKDLSKIAKESIEL